MKTRPRIFHNLPSPSNLRGLSLVPRIFHRIFHNAPKLARHAPSLAIILALGAILLFSGLALADMQTDFSSGGAVRIGDYTGAPATTCNASATGALSYTGGVFQYCNGTTWANIDAGGSVGIDALTDARYDTTTDFNLDLGVERTFFVGAQQNLFIGQLAGANGTSLAMDANVGIGYQALTGLTTGNTNAALGYRALATNSTGGSNTAVGYQALQNNSTGGANTAVGFVALQNNTFATGNTAVGYDALQYKTLGDNNTALGMQAMFGNGVALTGNNNTAVGQGALYNIQGAAADNTVVGTGAGSTTTTGSSNILIGSGVVAPAATTSNWLNIGNTIYANMSTGNVGIGTANPGAKLQITESTTGAGSESLRLQGTFGGAGQGFLKSIKWHDGTNIVGGIGAVFDGTNVNFQIHSLYAAAYKTETDVVMTVKGNGNVGIGTTSPGDMLHVFRSESGLNNGRILLGDGTVGGYLQYSQTASGRVVLGNLSNAGGSANQINFGFGAVTGGTPANAVMTINQSGNVGIGTTAPSYKLSLDGQAAQTIGMERDTTAATPGQALTVRAGGAVSGGTNLAGGDAVISGGTATGSGTSKIILQGAGYGVSGTADAAPAEVGRVTGGGYVQFKGTTFGNGDTMATAGADTGIGIRMLWYPAKAAFRVGEVTTATRWNEANTGAYSMGLGKDVLPSGAETIAWGRSTVAAGQRSTAGGMTTEAYGDASTAFGQYAKAGDTAGVNGNYSMALGLTSVATASTAKVTGNGSMMIAMQDQHNVNMTANNTVAVLGGTMIVNPATAQGAAMVTTPASTLDVRGEVQLGNTGAACAAGTAGAMRYNSGTSTMEYCNGTAWAPIAPAAGGCSTTWTLAGRWNGVLATSYSYQDTGIDFPAAFCEAILVIVAADTGFERTLPAATYPPFVVRDGTFDMSTSQPHSSPPTQGYTCAFYNNEGDAAIEKAHNIYTLTASPWTVGNCRAFKSLLGGNSGTTQRYLLLFNATGVGTQCNVYAKANSTRLYVTESQNGTTDCGVELYYR